jgi:hypothetical protein
LIKISEKSEDWSILLNAYLQFAGIILYSYNRFLPIYINGMDFDNGEMDFVGNEMNSVSNELIIDLPVKNVIVILV